MLQPGWSDSQISGFYMCDKIILQLILDFQKLSQLNLQHFFNVGSYKEDFILNAHFKGQVRCTLVDYKTYFFSVFHDSPNCSILERT